MGLGRSAPHPSECYRRGARGSRAAAQWGAVHLALRDPTPNPTPKRTLPSETPTPNPNQAHTLPSETCFMAR